MDDLDLAVELFENIKKKKKLQKILFKGLKGGCDCQRITFINQYNFYNSIYWYIDFMCAHTIGTAISWTIVTIAELFRINFVVL